MHTPISQFIILIISFWYCCDHKSMVDVGRIYGKYAKFIRNSKEGADGCPSWGSTSTKRTCCVYSNTWTCIHCYSCFLLLIEIQFRCIIHWGLLSYLQSWIRWLLRRWANKGKFQKIYDITVKFFRSSCDTFR